MKKVALIIGLITIGLTPVIAQTPIHFNAKGLVVLSDADVSASTLIDGKVVGEKNVKDQLTTIKFPLQRGSESLGRVPIPNSVLGLSKSLSVGNNSKFIYSLESYSNQIKDAKDAVVETQENEKIYVVDINNLNQPSVKYAFAVGTKATSLDINNNEIALVTNKKGNQVAFIQPDADGKPVYYLEIATGLDENTTISNVIWHTSGDYVVFAINKTNEIGLFRIIREAGKIKNMEPVGSLVKLAGTPRVGEFSKDGKRFFILDGKATTGNVSGLSEINVIDFSFDGKTDHKIVNKVPTGENTGSFAISPDGKTMVAVNAGKSVTAWTAGGTSKGSSLILFRVGGNAGLAKVSEYPFEGIFPQSVVFDKDGSNIAVSVYEYPSFGYPHGGVEFWSVIKGEFPELKRQNTTINVMKGAHTLRVIQ